MLHARRRRWVRRLTVAAVAVACVAASGCSGAAVQTQPTPSPSPSAAAGDEVSSAPSGPSVTPTASGTPAPPTPPQNPGRSAAHRRAFAEFVMAAWAHALRTNEAGPLLEASGSPRNPCDGCADLQRELERRAEQGWYVDFPGLEIRAIELERVDRRVTVAVADVAIPESDTLHEDGSYRSTSPAHPDAEFEVRMRWTGEGYRLLAFGLG